MGTYGNVISSEIQKTSADRCRSRGLQSMAAWLSRVNTLSSAGSRIRKKQRTSPIIFTNSVNV